MSSMSCSSWVDMMVGMMANKHAWSWLTKQAPLPAAFQETVQGSLLFGRWKQAISSP